MKVIALIKLDDRMHSAKADIAALFQHAQRPLPGLARRKRLMHTGIMKSPPHTKNSADILAHLSGWGFPPEVQERLGALEVVWGIFETNLVVERREPEASQP